MLDKVSSRRDVVYAKPGTDDLLYLEMSNADEAAMALEKFHNQEFEGRRLVVNEAKPQAPRENNNNRGGGSRNNRW